MRTTLDLSDELFRAAKIAAVQRGTTLRELITHALERELSNPKQRPAKKTAANFPVFASRAAGKLKLSRLDLRAAEDEEDARRHGLPAGR